MKSKKVKFNKIFDRLADRLPDRLLGNRDRMKKKYISVYSDNGADELIENARRKTGKLYIMLAAVMLVMLLAFIAKLFLNPGNVLDLKRNSYEGDAKHITAEIEAEYEGETEKRSANIQIKPRALSESEKLKRMERTKKNLPTLIMGDNKRLSAVTYDLDLVTVDPKTGVEIAWNSSNEEMLDEDGSVNPLLAKPEEPIMLDADLRIDGILDHVRIRIDFGSPESGRELSEAMNASINNLIENLNESDEGNSIKLPDKTPEGVSLKWSADDAGSIVAQLVLVIFMALVVYHSRYNFLYRKMKETKDDIIKDFPDFMNKLVLLLNAGLVITAAFEKITDDYRIRYKDKRKKYIYEEFCNMEDNINMSNSGFLMELNDIAQRSGVRDVMRFNTIIVDNIDKGSALVDKLQSEVHTLWISRIKLAEEKGRLAETKLTFPMVLQLLVLIIITIAPAALEM